MQFIREQRNTPGYNPNLRHCIMGQDGDLIMLGLATHEPNLVLLREQVRFDKAMSRMESYIAKYGLGVYIHNAHFEFLHMNVLRDYLAFEFETSNIMPDSPYDLERTIDDFVFMTFLVGNDFLPHMPSIDIADEAFDFLFYTYRHQRVAWLKQKKENPYLTDAGNIVSGSRLESFLQAIGDYESKYYAYKKSTEDLAQKRKLEAKWGTVTTPSDEVLRRKEEEDRLRFRNLLQQPDEQNAKSGFKPVLSRTFEPREEENRDEGIFLRMGNLLQYGNPDQTESGLDDQDLKGRYYADKFGFSPFDAEKHMALRKAYIEGLVWCLKYYYEGCVSWEWYYPYHYGPMISDLVDVNKLLKEVSFENKLGKPLKPFEQLLACLPPSHSELLPEPYRWLMTSKSSPIIEFYPQSFTVDMNGKRWPWEAVVLLPFIDSTRLLQAVQQVDESQLMDEERQRNQLGDGLIISHDPSREVRLPAIGKGVFDEVDKCNALLTPFNKSDLLYTGGKKPLLKPELVKGVVYPLPGLPTLRDGSVRSLWRRMIRVNVHGSPSRYKTALLELSNMMPEVHPIDWLARFIGTIIYINYPFMTEALVTAVSDANGIIRGGEDPKFWGKQEAIDREKRLRSTLKQQVFGQKLTGSGGLTLAQSEGDIENLKVLFNVRPLKGRVTMDDGQVVKSFSKFEVEVPIFATSWIPVNPDTRLANLPVRLEKDPYKATKSVITTGRSRNSVMSPDDKPTNGSTPFSKGEVISTTGSQLRAFSTKKIPETVKGRRAFSSLSQPSFQSANVGKLSTFQRGNVRSRLFAAGCVAALSFFSVCEGVNLNDGVSTVNNFEMHWASQWSVPFPEAKVDFVEEDLGLLPGQANSSPPPLEFAHGTTTVSFIFQGGIVAAVDSRASLGSFVGSKTVQKVLPVNTHILGTMAGGAADCMFWIRKLKGEAALFELIEEKRMSVARASRLLSNVLYDNRQLGLSVGSMIMGFDPTNKPAIFFVDNSGLRIRGDMFAVGSGSTFALGILDTERRYDMTNEEAIALGIKAIRHATFRDAYSGGVINVYLITANGWKRVFSDDLAADTTHKSEIALSPNNDG